MEEKILSDPTLRLPLAETQVKALKISTSKQSKPLRSIQHKIIGIDFKIEVEKYVPSKIKCNGRLCLDTLNS